MNEQFDIVNLLKDKKALIRYIIDMITSSETFVLTMQHYIKQLEQHLEECKRNNVSDTQIPEWAHKLMRDRYGMKLHG